MDLDCTCGCQVKATNLDVVYQGAGPNTPQPLLSLQSGRFSLAPVPLHIFLNVSPGMAMEGCGWQGGEWPHFDSPSHAPSSPSMLLRIWQCTLNDVVLRVRCTWRLAGMLRWLVPLSLLNLDGASPMLEFQSKGLEIDSPAEKKVTMIAYGMGILRAQMYQLIKTGWSVRCIKLLVFSLLGNLVCIIAYGYCYGFDNPGFPPMFRFLNLDLFRARKLM